MGIVCRSSPVSRTKNATGNLRQAVLHDPLSATIANELATGFWLGGRGDEAIVEARRAVALVRNARHLATLGWVLRMAGRHAEAAAVLDSARALDGSDSMVLSELAAVNALMGNAAISQTIYSELVRSRSASPVHVALAAAWAGREDDVFTWLERARSTRDPMLGFPLFWQSQLPQAFRNDARFARFSQPNRQ